MHEVLNELEFVSEEILLRVQKRVEKRLRKASYAKMNRWAALLFEEALLEKKEIPHELKQVNPLVGLGVFATAPIPELSFVGEYTGVVRKRNRREDEKNDYVFGYVVGPKDTPWVIDAEKKGNFTRFINHSYEPNLTSRWLISKGVCHIIFFANRLIMKGEQLTYDYGPYYWRNRSFPQTL